MKIACQGITFGGERGKDNIESILKSVSNAGYDGFETGFPRYDPQIADSYKPLLEKYSLKLAAIHIGGDFQDDESAEKQIDKMPELAELTLALDCKDIFISVGSPKDGEAYELTAKRLNALGAKLRELGVTLSYHNHDWEIKNNAHGLLTIYENTDSQNLLFVPDIGWVTRGGANPVEFVKQIGNRLSHVHFKEFTADGDFTEIGRGVVDFKGVYKFLKDTNKADNMWIVAEQDRSDIGADESVRINCEYIRGLE